MTPDDMAALLGALRTIPNHTVYEGEPPSTPPTRYICVYDSPGIAAPQRYVAASIKVAGDVRVICAAVDPAGLRATVRAVRDTLTDMPLTYGRLRETETGPFIQSGDQSGRRISATIVYTFHNVRSAQ